MTMKEQHGLGGCLHIVLRDPSGAVLERRQIRNLITTAGKMLLAGYFSGIILGKPQMAIAVGSSDDEVSEVDTALKKQMVQVEASVPSVDVKKESGVDRVVATVTATLPATEEEEQQQLREAGILITPPNAAPVLYNRVVFPVVTRTGNMEMTLTWDVVF
jgi:hypothetical protein